MPYADFHTHSFLRPYEENELGSVPVMSDDPGDVTSVWHLGEVSKLAQKIDELIGFVRYTEADLSNVTKNDSAVIITSLYAVESGFFFNLRDDTAEGLLAEGLGVNVVMGALISHFPKSKVKFTNNPDYDYFKDLVAQYKCVVQPASFAPDPIKCEQEGCTELKSKSYAVAGPGTTVALQQDVVKIVISIEGGNCLWSNVMYQAAPGKTDKWNGRNFPDKFTLKQVGDYRPLHYRKYRGMMSPDKIVNAGKEIIQLIPMEVCTQLLVNVKELKGLPIRPFFITLSHHFYNGMCGHATSLQPLSKIIDQSFGMNTEITNLGWMVIYEMLRESDKRILVDVKHMSVRARFSYYAFRKTYFKDVPVIFSHGSVYGGSLKFDPNDDFTYPQIIEITDPNAPNFDPYAAYFYKHDINLFDDDIREVVNSGGLIGVEIDQRVNGVKADGHDGNGKMPEMIWHNFRYIAEKASIYKTAEQSAWDFAAIGSDFDGIINPMDNYGTAADIPALREYIKSLLVPYLKTTTALKDDADKAMPVDTILDKIFFNNVISFTNKYYK